LSFSIHSSDEVAVNGNWTLVSEWDMLAGIAMSGLDASAVMVRLSLRVHMRLMAGVASQAWLLSYCCMLAGNDALHLVSILAGANDAEIAFGHYGLHLSL
jgi:hypothetical protein